MAKKIVTCKKYGAQNDNLCICSSCPAHTTADMYAFNLSEYESYAGSMKCEIATPSTAVQKENSLLKTSLVEAGASVEGYIFYAVPLYADSIKVRNKVQSTTWKINIE